MHCPVHPVMLSPISGPIALKEDVNLLTELGVVANSGHSMMILLLMLLIMIMIMIMIMIIIIIIIITIVFLL